MGIVYHQWAPAFTTLTEPLLMDWKAELIMAFDVLLASVLGGIIGWERETEGRDAGVRTYAAVALGSCVFALVAAHLMGDANPHVIAAGVVTGVGFIGAGVIMQERGSIIGLTTAATLWASASIGLAIGYELYLLAVSVTVIVYVLLALQRWPAWERITTKASIKDEAGEAALIADTGVQSCHADTSE